jgi:hypothetical protein
VRHRSLDESTLRDTAARLWFVAALFLFAASLLAALALVAPR